MSDWQPIETAPKDGAQILGFADGDRAVVQWYQKDQISDGGYWSLTVCGACAERGEWMPTHWQPLPDPPGPPSECRNGLKTDRPDRLRAGDVWEFETELPVKGKQKPVAQLLQWRVIGWHQGQYAWELNSIDGRHTVYLMEFSPQYEEMRFIGHDHLPTP